MIIVEIEVPVMGKRYDFQIDESVPLCEVKEEIVEMICRKEQCLLRGDPGRLLLWTQSGAEIRQQYSARGNGLRTGERLLLV